MRALFLLFLLLTSAARAEKPGLTLELSKGGQTTSRQARMAALFVPQGETVSPFLEAGPFQAVWSGSLKLEKRSRLYFSFKGQGQARLLINGKLVLEQEGQFGNKESERFRLNKGKHTFRLEYRSPKKGASQLRLLWRSRDFATEAIPPRFFVSEKLPSELKLQGRQLTAAYRCF